jgi:glycosyltransferase involved in cell wall biosynthesis
MRFSVIVPVYNRAASIGESLESVFRQSHAPDEVIVVDDGSTDDLDAALAPFKRRILLLRQDNSGVSAARNAGAAVASGDWLKFQDSDDLWDPTHLATVVRDLSTASHDVVAHLGDLAYNVNGERRCLFELKGHDFPIDHAERIEDALGLVITGMSLLSSTVRKDVFDAMGGLDEEMRFFEDSALFLHLALRGSFLVTGKVLVESRRLHGDDSSLTSIERRDPIYARRMVVRALTQLSSQPLEASRQRLVNRALAGAEFRLAEAIYPTDRGTARELLWKSAQRHPSQLRGWGKSLFAAALGSHGFRLLLRDMVVDRR